MSVYRTIVDAVEDAVYVHKYKTYKQIAWYVEWWTGIRNINPREVEKMVNKITTEYKKA